MASIYTNYHHNGRFRLDYSVADVGNRVARVTWAVYFEYTQSGFIYTAGVQLWMNGHHHIDQAYNSKTKHYNGDKIGGSTYDLNMATNGDVTVSWNLQGNVYDYTTDRNCKTNGGADASATYNFGPANNTVYISHWTWGYKNGEGNNGNKTAYKLADTSFSVSSGSNYTMDASRAVTIPKGFSLVQECGGGSYASSWTTYKFPATFKADRNPSFEYDYQPISYSITYTMNGGTNASSNPSSYNVLYGVTFANPSRTGYTFKNWTIGGSAVTGINPGANATFSSPNDLRTKTNSRTTGNKTVVANWTANTYTVTLDQQSGSGGTTSVNITYDTAKGSYPTITLPKRVGYTFKGYYTGTNGSGTQYYDANGNSTRAFQIASNTVWYAYWIQNDVRINVSGAWKSGDTYVNVNGAWKRATAVYVNVNGTWKQING